MAAPPPPIAPAFRRLDIHQVDDGEQRGIVLLDPLGLVADQTFVPEGLLPVVGLFDGVRTIEHIQSELESAHGDAVPPSLVGDLVRQFDERLLLLSPRFDAALRDAAQAFTAAGSRPAQHAGSAGYPADADALRQALGSMVNPAVATRRAAPRGLVAPHIDLARGREGYAQAYGYLAECEPADLYVVFGTGHQGPASVVTGLAVDWDTPLGAVRTDRAFVDAVHDRLGAPDALDVFLHRSEHSLEFQMLFLRHVLGDRPFEVAGFLTGGLPRPQDGDGPAAEVLDTLRAAAAASGKRVCYVAGADLAHVGPFFGDKDKVSSSRLDELAGQEKERLAHLEKGNPPGFHASVEAGGNPDRVCGTTPMYLTAMLAGGAGELLYYGQAPAADQSQVVSFCAVAYGDGE